MKRRFPLFPMTFAAAALAGVAAVADTGIKTGDSSAGPVLTNTAGMTLYTFDKDDGGVSACYEKCAMNWPPLLAPAGAAPDDDFALVKRTDGTMQWTFYGKPLYLFAKDTKPGDITGEGIGGVWHIAVPTE